MSKLDKLATESLIEQLSAAQKTSQAFETEDAQTGLGACLREAQIDTPKASLYLNKLCKHFTHRVPAHWNRDQGKVFFDMGWCFFTATAQTLSVRCEANSMSDLEQILETVKSHFDRFAVKDALVLKWL